MTERELESGPAIPEAEETPSPSVPSVPEGDEPTSAAPTDDVSALRQELSELKGSIADQIERGLQSIKDQRIQRMMDRMDTIEGKLGEAPQEPEPSEEQVVGATESTVEGRMQRFARRILGTAGIQADSPEYKQFVENYAFVSEDKFYDDLEVWADQTTTKAARQESAAGPASVSAPTGTSTVSDDPDEIAAELERLQKPGPNEPGLTHPDNIARRKELNAKLRELAPRGKIVGGRFIPD